ncbi:MAG: polysaccharide biosynthesis/export family protein [Parachlamydiaceae bacterium]|nr:polysaccharide biosynthesis/export family protein [Parachlamydiaceae bacterium]
MHIIFCFLSLLLFSSCSRPYCDYAVMGADEFVMDSYKIRQGKLAILELEGIEVGELPPEAMYEYRDMIAEDDILNIAVYHPSRKDLMESFQFINDTVGGFRVYQGRVDLPDISPVVVEGLTLEEARRMLQEQFRDHIRDTEVFVTYKDRLKRKVELTGMVGTPTVPVDGKIRLYEVLAKAQLPPNANLFMSYVIRDGCPLPIDLHRLINQGEMCHNIVMRGGDKIFIANPADSTVMLMGEVRLPRAVNLPYGFMSLREALVTAGGIPFTGDNRRIQVIRGNLKCPKIYVLAWEHIVHLPNDSLLLMPGDTVYVTEKPITQWNRFIEQLIPSFYGLNAGYSAYRVTRD